MQSGRGRFVWKLTNHLYSGVTRDNNNVLYIFRKLAERILNAFIIKI